jgi:hypothetical protein
VLAVDFVEELLEEIALDAEVFEAAVVAVLG